MAKKQTWKESDVVSVLPPADDKPVAKPADANGDLVEVDISDEYIRVYTFPGTVYIIKFPARLVVTPEFHRIVDRNGWTHDVARSFVAMKYKLDDSAPTLGNMATIRKE